MSESVVASKQNLKRLFWRVRTAMELSSSASSEVREACIIGVSLSGAPGLRLRMLK